MCVCGVLVFVCVLHCVFVHMSVFVCVWGGEVRGQLSVVSSFLPPWRGTWIDSLASRNLQP